MWEAASAAEIKHANAFKREQEGAQRVGLLGLWQVQDAPRPLLAEEDKDKIPVACSESAFEWSQVSPSWSYPAAAVLLQCPEPGTCPR